MPFEYDKRHPIGDLSVLVGDTPTYDLLKNFFSDMTMLDGAEDYKL